MDNGSDNKQPSKAGHKLSFSSRFVTAPFLVLEEENQIALAGLRVTRLKKKKDSKYSTQNCYLSFHELLYQAINFTI